MKKIIALLIAIVMIVASFSVLTVFAEEDPAFYIHVTEQKGLAFEQAEDGSSDGDNTPLVLNGATVAADAAMPGCAFFFGSLASTVFVEDFKLFADGVEKAKGASVTFNALKADPANKGEELYPDTDEIDHMHGQFNLYIKLAEGHYDEVLVKALTSNGQLYTIMKFTDLTVTAAENVISDEGVPVEATPCWKLLPADIAAGTGGNAISFENVDDMYTTITATEKGDPYASYVSSMTKIGRYLLIKYNNHTIIPRMQIYMAQKSITSDSNMIEFDIAADQSGWTYVVVDLSQNQFYDKDTMSLGAFRFDPLEARNVNGGKYKFDGTETIDVAYIMGFTTKAGLEQFLEANELHDVHKKATLVESQVEENGGTYTYADVNGDVHEVVPNGDGTFGYEYDARDVRVPCDTTPVALFAGSKLLGTNNNKAETTYDPETGIATLTATGEDPNIYVFTEDVQAARYMSIKYKTSVAGNMEFFMSSTTHAAAGGESFIKEINADGDWHTEIIDLASVGVAALDTETYKLGYLRYDFFCAATEGSVDVEYIAFHDSEDAAYQYVHTYKTYKVTFKANNKTVATVVFEPGTKTINVPEVPPIDGYTGVWEDFTLADKNITVKAVYTKIQEETQPSADETTVADVTDETTANTPDDTTVEIGETTTVADTGADTDDGTKMTTGDDTTSKPDDEKKSGCGGTVICGGLALIAVLGCAVVLKKKD